MKRHNAIRLSKGAGTLWVGLMTLAALTFPSHSFALEEFPDGGFIVGESEAPSELPLDEGRVITSEPPDGQVRSEEAGSLVDVAQLALENKGTVLPGTYVISPLNASDKVIDVFNGSRSSGSNVQLYSCNMTGAQKWDISEDSAGFLTIRNAGSGLVLDVSAGLAFDGSNVQQYSPNNSLAQKWVAVRNNDGSVTFYSALGKHLVLDVQSASSYNGANIDIYTKNGTPAQSFNVYEVTDRVDSAGRVIEDGLYIIASESLALDVGVEPATDGTQLLCAAPDGSISQVYRITYDSEIGFYTIAAVGSGHLLDADNGSVLPGSGVNLWGSVESDGHPMQRYWKIVQDGAGYRIINASSNGALSFSQTSGSARVATVPLQDSSSWTLSPADSSFTWDSKDVDELAKIHCGEMNNGVYVISSSLRVRSVLDVANGSSSNCANIQLYDSNNSKAQRWSIENVGNGYVRIRNVGSDKVLDVASGRRLPGSNVQQHAWNGSDAQLWVPVKQEDGSYLLYSRLGRSLVLDISSASMSNGANVQVYSLNASDAQRFDFILGEKAALSQSRTIPDGIYQISNMGNFEACLDVASASLNNGARVQTYSANGTLAQAFKVTFDDAHGSYSIRPAHSTKALDLNEGDPLPGGKVQQWDYSTTNVNQRWIIEDGPVDGGYAIRSAVSGLVLGCVSGNGGTVSTQHSDGNIGQCWSFRDFTPRIDDGFYSIHSAKNERTVIDVKGASIEDGALVQGYEFNGSFAQKWSVVKQEDGSYLIQNAGSGKYLSLNDEHDVVQTASGSDNMARWRIGVVFGHGLSLNNVGTGDSLTIIGNSKLSGLVGADSSAKGWKFSSINLVDEGFYELAPANDPDMRLDICDGSRSAGANAQIWQSNGTLNQRFWIRSAGNGWFNITACCSALDLDVEGQGTNPGTNVQQYYRGDNNKAQKWRFEVGPHGIRIISACGGNALDVAGGGTSNGTNVDVYSVNGTPAQGWILKTATRPAKIGWQNPAAYPQVSSLSVRLPSYCVGEFTYVTPSRIKIDASREECVNAFIQRAYDYLGTQYIEPWSTAPGGAVDCSGLVLQCLYATGMDMGVYNPYNHRWLPWQTYNSMNWLNERTFLPISTSDIQRGDLVYYRGHIAIAIGEGQIIDSWPGIGVTVRSMYAPGPVIGAQRPFV